MTPPTGRSGPEQPPPAQREHARIREGAVDDIVVGDPIPSHHLDGRPQYHARWVADAQPMEGFLIGTPPVWVILEKGPMDEVEPGPVEELTPTLAPKALEAARAGMPVGAILVERPGIVTAAGIGVGSSYESLRDAYGEIDLLRSPEWLDSNITCDATSKAFSGVRFLLESCEEGQPLGRVKRVFVTRARDVGPASP